MTGSRRHIALKPIRALWRALPFAAASVILAYGFIAASQTPALNRVAFEVRGDERCVTANGLPGHAVGRFPNPGNPNSIREQRYRYCFPAAPVKGAEPRPRGGTVAIAVNGVLVRPDTAGFWDPSSPRGFSRSGDRRWRLEAMGNPRHFGVDDSNAHVDRAGIYHYHGIPKGLVERLVAAGKAGNDSGGAPLVAYAADGFEIRYAGAARKASYRLKAGTRPPKPGGPGGRYDGRFIADWAFDPTAGDLDECNGDELMGAAGEPSRPGKYVYFVTGGYPFWPRCLWGETVGGFPESPRPRAGPGPGSGPGGGPPPGFGPPPGGYPPPGGHPPPRWPG